MMKVFLTGDNHIGLKYASHEKAAILAQNRITAFDGMVRTANDEDCSLFVIAGDLFESHFSASKKDIKILLEKLSRFRGTIVVLPGNHDYYDKDSKVWQCFKAEMTAYDNIMLLTENRPYELHVNDSDVVLYPALCTKLHSEPGENNLTWIKTAHIESDDVYRIGIAHGAVEGEAIDREGQYFTMTRSELEGIPVDVWLIGHTHVPFPNNLTNEFMPCEKILNAGTHVQTDVSCNTEGLCFIVEINENKTIRAKKYKSGNIRFYRKSITVTANEMEEILTRELAGIDSNSVVDVILSGAVSAEEYENRTVISEKSLSRFLEATYDDHALSRQISKAFIDAEFPETSFSAKFLTALLDNPKEAQLAYELINTLKDEK